MTLKTPSVKTQKASDLINLDTYTAEEHLIVSKAKQDKTYVGRAYSMSPIVGGGGEFATVIQNIFKSCPDDSVIQVSLISEPDYDAPTPNVSSVGWNFLFTGSTTLAMRAWRPEEKDRAQAAINFFVFATMAVSSLASTHVGQSIAGGSL